MEFADLYFGNQTNHLLPLSFEPDAVARRAIANASLSYLADAPDGEDVLSRLVYEQFTEAKGMTDKLAALSILVWNSHKSDYKKYAETALASFYADYKDNGDVVDKWLSVQSMNPKATIADLQALLSHPACDIGNPNRVRSVMGGFVMRNPSRFHDISGDGYAFLAGFIAGYAEKNDTTAARLVEPLMNWRRYEPKRREMMKKALSGLLQTLVSFPQEKVKCTLEKVQLGLAE
jgi:aminopeptidase N